MGTANLRKMRLDRRTRADLSDPRSLRRRRNPYTRRGLHHSNRAVTRASQAPQPERLTAIHNGCPGENATRCVPGAAQRDSGTLQTRDPGFFFKLDPGLAAHHCAIAPCCAASGESRKCNPVMAGLVPAIHVLLAEKGKTWMPATSAGMTLRAGRAPKPNGLMVTRREAPSRTVRLPPHPDRFAIRPLPPGVR